MPESLTSLRCPVCKNTGTLEQSSVTRFFRPLGQLVSVVLETSKCNTCGTPVTVHSQHERNLKALASRRARYGGHLLGEDFIELRKRYGLTQQAAGKIFGKGLVAFSRYENETSYPDKSTRLLIQLALENKDVLKSLADKAGVEVPLWEARNAQGVQAFENPLATSFINKNSEPQ